MKLHITMNPADDCDRGCTHCICESTPDKGTRMTLETMDILIEEVQKLNPEKLLLTYTGGGEPFRNPLITNLIEKPLEPLGDKIVEMRIVTSGFLDKDTDEIDRYRLLLEKPYSGFIRLLLSFNLFNSQFPVRLINALTMIMKHRSRMGLTFIRLCLSCEGFGRSYRALEKTLNKFCSSTYSDILPMFTEVPKDQMDFANHFFLPEKRLGRRSDEEMSEEGLGDEVDRYKLDWKPERWSEDQEQRMIDEAYLYELFCFVENPMYMALPLIVQPFSLANVGRAEKLKDTPICDFHCETVLGKIDREWQKIVVGADGGLYPQMDCCGSKRMSLGKLGRDSLSDALKRKRKFSAVIMKEILRDRRMFDRDTDVCKICKSIKFRLKL